VVASRTNVSSAVTISEYYIDGQIATDANFTTGVQNVDLSGSSPSVTIPDGDYFQFGVALVLTDNPNPASGDAWDLANQAKGNPVQPQNLGISSVEFNVPSSDTNQYSLAVILGPADPPTTPPQFFDSTAVINPNLAFIVSSPGLAGNGGETGLLVSNVGNINPNSAAVTELGYFAGADATLGHATPLFTNLAFQGKAAGQVTLSPAIEDSPFSGSSLFYWKNQTLGSVGANGNLTTAKYSPQNQLSPADTIDPLPVITVNITPIQPFLSVNSFSPPATYGNDVPLFGPSPFERLPFSFLVSNPMQGTKFYFAVPDLDSSAPYVTVYLSLQSLHGVSENDIDEFVGDINNSDDGVVAVAGTVPNGFGFSGYNLLLQVPQSDFSQPNGNLYIGMDFAQIPNIPDVADLYMRQILILPEPTSIGLFMGGCTALIGARRKRNQSDLQM
jgi:hypothetical protein